MSLTTPIHGNYHGYYSKRPHGTTDSRLALLPPTLFKNKHVLDIGCNEGWVTCEIGLNLPSTTLHNQILTPQQAQVWGASKVVGVDIDDSLIQAAWRRRRTVWSLQAPSNNPAQDAKPNYFPASFEHSFGSLPIPPSSNRGHAVFPHNIAFRTANWCVDTIPEDKDGYDVVIAFSITKWIHLHTLDTGLLSFFQRIFSVLRQGGILVLEPQPWESYTKARRMSETLKRNYKSLTLRPENFADILKEIGFHDVRHYGTVGDGGFCRPIDVYVKP